MKIVIIPYFLTGNSIAAEFAVEQIKITEPKPRTMGAIILDMLFNRTLKVNSITMSDTSAYRLKDNDVKSLTATVVKIVRETMARQAI